MGEQRLVLGRHKGKDDGDGEERISIVGEYRRGRVIVLGTAAKEGGREGWWG